MEEQTPAESYRVRAAEALAAAKNALAHKHKETAVSRAYYACFYAIHSRLEELGETAGSHKQVGILFRKHFIKTKRIDVKLSRMLRELSNWRMEADYAPTPALNQALAANLVASAEEFVTTLLACK
ncbi:MAG: HEPN domain-containing protein [Deltaproteobacteria bacterium]|nr:HEPN domain-containing protein [Deltaproteobacteria bacterium]